LKRYINLCREETRQKTENELDSFIQDIFKNSIVSTEKKLDKISKFNMVFTTIGGRQVCRNCCATAYGFSSNKFKTCSNIFKQTDLQKVSSLSHRKWKDDHIHNFTYAETEKLFKSNVLKSKDEITMIERAGLF
jgi:hypothetical protein